MKGSRERQILKDIRSSKRQACELLVCEHYKPIFRFMAYLTGDVNLAEDLTQETFASVWTNIKEYKGRASIGTWLHKIAYHKFIDSRRKFERRAAMIDKIRKSDNHSSVSSNPLHQLISDESSMYLLEAVQNLEPAEQLVIILHYIQGLTFRQIAKILDSPCGTVKWRTSRALKKLKTLLTGRI